MDCQTVQKFKYLYIDGEFDEQDRVDFEAHLRSCSDCRESVDFEKWFQAGVRSKLNLDVAPLGLRSRILSELESNASNRRSWLAKMLLIPAPAVFVVGLLVYLVLINQSSVPTTGIRNAGVVEKPSVYRSDIAPASFFHSEKSEHLSEPSFHDMMEESVRKHAKKHVLDVASSDRADVVSYFRSVYDFPFDIPKFGLPASLRGGRLVNLQDQNGAHIVYNVNGRKLSLFVTRDEHNPPLLYDGEVRLHSSGRYNIAFWRHLGTTYSLTSTLSPDKVLRLVSTAVRQ